MEEMYSYRSLVMMLSVSSSKASSSSLICADTSGTLFIITPILSSLSRSLMAKKRFCPSGTLPPSFSSTALMAASTFRANSCMGAAAAFLLAAVTTFFTTASSPVPFRAEISVSSHPSLLASLSVCILSPAFSTTSIMFTAMTTGMPSSVIWVDRYRFLSILVPSTILMIASGLSLIR